MAITYGFFDSVNGDRKYNADQMSKFYTGIANDGVFQHIDNGLAVSAGTGLTVNVATGRALIKKKWVENDAVLTKTISAASATYARIDAVVIRFSKSNRNISIVVKDGTPAASPSAPSMTRNSDVYEMALAYVNVAANATSVTVTDKRSDTTVCGWVSVAQQTSGEVDAQLNAMKTGFDEVVYDSPGAAVRGSDQKIFDATEYIIPQIKDIMTKGAKPYDMKFEIGGLNNMVGGKVDNPAAARTSEPVSFGDASTIYIKVIPGVNVGGYWLNSDYSYNSRIPGQANSAGFIVLTNEHPYVMLQFVNLDSSNMTAEEYAEFYVYSDYEIDQIFDYSEKTFETTDGVIAINGTVQTGTGVKTTVSVHQYEKYKISGYTYSTQYFPFILQMDGSTIVSGIFGSAGENEDYIYTVPSGVSKIYINGRTSGDIKISKYEVIPPKVYVDEKVAKIEEEIKSPYQGKSAVFFGTSIPAGTVVIDDVAYSIPTYVGKLLGMTVYNEAAGESCARRGWENATSADDPYGWTGHNWRNVFWAMGANIEEKQDLINNYTTKWYNLLRAGSDKPQTIDATTQAKIIASSYVNKLVPYLDGTKPMPDLFVFEHGHNDADYSDPSEISGIASSNPDNIADLNRSLFGDVMAFYIRLIWQYNPQAKILIVSNYENDSSYYEPVFTAQKEVAESNKVWFCNVADVIGWSSVKKVTTTGYWSNGYWVPSGGESQTITRLQAAFPDSIHPFTDLSGNAVIRESEVIANYIKANISL